MPYLGNSTERWLIYIISDPSNFWEAIVEQLKKIPVFLLRFLVSGSKKKIPLKE